MRKITPPPLVPERHSTSSVCWSRSDAACCTSESTPSRAYLRSFPVRVTYASVRGWLGLHIYLEVWGDKGPRAVPLSGERFTIGTDPSNDLTLDDPAVSALHAVLDHFPAGWS